MKKVFALILFACMALFSGVILSSCGEDNADRTISIKDTSGLCDVRLINMSDGSGKYIQGSGGVYRVANHTNVKVEIYAMDYGVDFSELEVVRNGQKLEKKKDIFDTDRASDEKYSPVPDGGSLYYGYFTIAYIDGNVSVTLSKAKMVSSTFTFQVENLEETQDFLKATKIDVSKTDQKDFVSFYDFLTGDNPSLTRVFDATAETELNSYRTFHLSFDGVAPFDFSDAHPFRFDDDESLYPAFGRYGKEYILDLGAENVGDQYNYNITVDFSNVTFAEYQIDLPEDNQTFQIVASATRVNVNNVADTTFSLTKKMETPVFGVVADYSEMQVLVNETPLVFDEENGTYSFPEEVLSPYMTETERDTFQISVAGIKYMKEEEEVSPVPLEFAISNFNLNFSDINPKFYGVDEQGSKTGVTTIVGADLPYAIEGQKYILSWAYNTDEQGDYRTSVDFFDFGIRLINIDEQIFNLKDVLPEDNTLLEENVFKHQFDVQVPVEEDFETRQYTLRAYYNEDTEIFDKFELQFTCASENEDGFEFVVNEYQKNIDISSGLEDESAAIRCAVLDRSGEMTSEGWLPVGEEPLTRTVQAGYLVAFEIIISEEKFVSEYDFAIQTPDLAYLTGKIDPVDAEPGKRGFIIYFAITDLFYGKDVNKPFVLIQVG